MCIAAVEFGLVKVNYLFFPELGFILCLLILVFCFLPELPPDVPIHGYCVMHSGQKELGDSCRGSPVWVNVTSLDKEELGRITHPEKA